MQLAAVALVIAGAFPTLPSIPGLPNVPSLNGALNDAVLAQVAKALASTLNEQAPISVSNGADYPTVAVLPGKPFAPRDLSADVPALAMARVDGTIDLAPGDYTITLSVYCMNLYAHGPSGHAYVLTPLHGTRAAMIEALNLRAGLNNEPHGNVQALSWMLQAGAKYDELPAYAKSIVDREIPDFKSQLAESLVEKLQAQYQATIGNIPGAPPLDSILNKLGPTGTAISTLQSAESALLNASSANQALMDQLVPPGGTSQTGATPWSLTSLGVYERFITTGNYATPGQLQIRVVAEVLGAGPIAIRTPIWGGAGNPLSTLIQALSMGAVVYNPKWTIVVPPSPNGEPGGWMTQPTATVFEIGDGLIRHVPCTAVVGVPIVSTSKTASQGAASEAVEDNTKRAALQTWDWLQSQAQEGYADTSADICAYWRNSLNALMQASYPGARVTLN